MFNDLKEKDIKTIIKKYDLTDTAKIIKFIEKEGDNFGTKNLYFIVEYANFKRLKKKPYFHNERFLKVLSKQLPDMWGTTLKIVDPMCGVGIFLPLIIEKYKDKTKLTIELYDSDEDTIQIARALSKRLSLKRSFGVRFINGNYLSKKTYEQVDLLISDIPNDRYSNAKLRANYPLFVGWNKQINSIPPLLLRKLEGLTKYAICVVPKSFLTSNEYEEARSIISKFRIERIIDLDTYTSIGVNNENIALFVNFRKENTPGNSVDIYSARTDKESKINQRFLTSKTYPNWIMFRNTFFNRIAREMKFDVFNTMKISLPKTHNTLDRNGSVWVVKPENLNSENEFHKLYDGNDLFINEEDIKPNTNLAKTIDRDDLYAAYISNSKITVAKKPVGATVSNSFVLLEIKDEYKHLLTDEHIEFYNSEEFKKFYKIATNFSSQSLTVNNSTVFYFGLNNFNDGEEKEQTETSFVDFDEPESNPNESTEEEFPDFN